MVRGGREMGVVIRDRFLNGVCVAPGKGGPEGLHEGGDIDAVSILTRGNVTRVL